MIERNSDGILDEPVILEEGYNKKTYGIMKIVKENNEESGSIVENLLQDDIIIEFETDEEKEKILEVIPANFQTQVNGNTIIISFEKEEVIAPLYSKEYVSDAYRRSYLRFKYVGTGKITGTVKTPEFKKTISEMKTKIHQIKAEIYKADIETYNKDKIKATLNIEEFFYWLNRTGEIEILEEAFVGGQGVLYDISRGYRDTHIKCKYKFKGEEDTYLVIKTDKDYEPYDKYGKRIEELYEKFIEQMKESGEYYIEGTSVPKNKVKGENGIYYNEHSSDGRSAVILKDGEPCLILNDVESNRRNKFCRDKAQPIIYVSTLNNTRGYEQLLQEECLMRRKRKKRKKSRRSKRV